MDKLMMNKLDDMEMDKVSGGQCKPHGGKKRSRPGRIMGATEIANSMVANVDETQNASGWLGSSMVGK